MSVVERQWHCQNSWLAFMCYRSLFKRNAGCSMPFEAIEIPEEARAPKPWFPERPDEAVIREIKGYIKDHGTPYLWRGHTHTKPPSNAFPLYIGEFDLPKSHQMPERRSPCPCCTPTYPKYSREGKIAWFPDEGVIRCIGPDCFRALNKEGHDQAIAQLKREEQRRRDVSYLLSRIEDVPDIIYAIDEAIEIAAAIDELHVSIKSRLKLFRLRLWDQIKDDGALNIRVRRNEIHRRRDGEEVMRTIMDLQRYSSIQGFGLINPNYRRIEPKLRTARANLEFVELSSATTKDALYDMTDEHRMRLAQSLARGIRQVRESFAVIADVREFISVTTLATLRTWGAQPGCPTPFFIRREDSDLVLGPSANNIARVKVSSFIDVSLPLLPDVPKVLSDDE